MTGDTGLPPGFPSSCKPAIPAIPTTLVATHVPAAGARVPPPAHSVPLVCRFLQSRELANFAAVSRAIHRQLSACAPDRLVRQVLVAEEALLQALPRPGVPQNDTAAHAALPRARAGLNAASQRLALRPVARQALAARLAKMQEDFDRVPLENADDMGLWLARLGRVDEARWVLQQGIERNRAEPCAREDCFMRSIDLIASTPPRMDPAACDRMTGDLFTEWMHSRELARRDVQLLGGDFHATLYESNQEIASAQWQVFLECLDMRPDELAALAPDIRGLLPPEQTPEQTPEHMPEPAALAPSTLPSSIAPTKMDAVD